MKKIYRNAEWSLVNILALKASYIIRMYGNKNYESFEKLFDVMIKYFPFSDAINIANVIKIDTKANEKIIFTKVEIEIFFIITIDIQYLLQI